MREEAGTPAIVESVRAGLVFQLKDAVTTDVIMQREHEIVRCEIVGYDNTCKKKLEENHLFNLLRTL